MTLMSTTLDRQGFVYILSSPLLRTADGTPILKIGATRNHPIQRTREISAGTGVPTKFELSYYRSFPDAFDAETSMHEEFSHARVNQSREFFAVPIQVAIEALDNLARELGDGSLKGGTFHEVDSGPPVATPWAELFALFPDDGSPRELSDEEQAKCRALETQLS